MSFSQSSASQPSDVTSDTVPGITVTPATPLTGQQSDAPVRICGRGKISSKHTASTTDQQLEEGVHHIEGNTEPTPGSDYWYMYCHFCKHGIENFPQHLENTRIRVDPCGCCNFHLACYRGWESDQEAEVRRMCPRCEEPITSNKEMAHREWYDDDGNMKKEPERKE
ncbi:hypothetical protein FPQ18DRAFT_396102 [Pyronema domesticum]|nr:hypothetical protein FPQ18DRAFT_396102 [Pyronema domesticum]